MPEGLRVFMGLVSLIVMCACIYFLFLGTVWNFMETNGLINTKLGIDCLIEQIRVRNIKLREEEHKRMQANSDKWQMIHYD